MGITSLNNALSGLSLAQRQIDVISNNVANVGTEGYTRKTLPQYAQVVGNAGLGVRPSIVVRAEDISLTRTLWTQESTVAYNAVQETYLSRVQEFHGTIDSETNISAELSTLQSNFIALSDSPTDALLQGQVVNQAIDTANKINEFSNHLTTLRNDVQNEMEAVITEINALLNQISDLNGQVSSATISGQSTAATQDLRDQAVKDLSELMEISFFSQGDGKMVIQTSEGVELVGRSVHELTFNPSQLTTSTFYPDSAAGVYIGDPNESNTASFNITEIDVNGKLGGLLELRDETLPKQSAQLDELAFQMARRFDAQGLRLFTDETGTVPSNDPPDLTTTSETAVSYVGFSRVMQVNQAIVNDTSILQTGTESGVSIADGSNEVINRVLNYAFGTVNYQEASGGLDLTAVSGGATTLQDYLGVRSSASVTGLQNLNAYADAADFVTATGGSVSASENTLRFTFEEPDLAYGPFDLDIDLTAVPDSGGNFADDIVAHINATLMPALVASLPLADQTELANMNVQFDVSSSGQLEVTSRSNITVDATSAANPLGATNLEYLGFTAGTTQAEDPYFDIAVGNNEFTRITIDPNDTETQLLTALEDVTGLAERYNGSGHLELRPGNSHSDPDFGGELKIISGNFTVDTAGAGAALVPDGINLVSAIFGSFIAGSPAQDQSPITTVNYGSEVSTSDNSTVGFREDFLGPGANLSLNIGSSSSLLDFAQNMITEQAQELSLVQNRLDNDSTFKDLIEDQLLNQVGVNMDEELSNLVVIQTAYSAAARVISAVEELFDELISIL